MLALATEPNFWAQWLQIVLIDLLLAGDNAIVIAMAVRLLPPREQRLGRLWGTLGAVVLRLVFLAMAAWLFKVPLLPCIGGLLLLWIAYKLLAPKAHGHIVDPAAAAAGAESVAARVRAGNNLRDAIRIIVLADVSMSIDNVLAVTGAAKGNLTVAVLGIALSIPMVVWGSVVLGKLMERQQWIVWLGGGILGYVAGSLILDDPKIVEWFGHAPHQSWHPLSLALGAAFLLFGWWSSRHGRAAE